MKVMAPTIQDVMLLSLVILVIVLTASDAEFCSKNVGLTCTNCTHVEFCDPYTLETVFINCDQLTKGSQVFCNAGDCSADPNPECSSSNFMLPEPRIERDFICQVSGFVPDPTNCRQYYTCPQMSGVAQLHTCPPNTQYNANTFTCEKYAKCLTVDCANNGSLIVAYDSESPFYVYCNPDSTTGERFPLVLRCQEGLIFQGGKCVVQTTSLPCTGIGRFPDPHNCRVYHNCTAADKPSLRIQCPANHFYSISPETCLRQIFTDQCVTINCGGNKAPLQVFEPNCQYYTDCRASPMVVYKCPSGKLLNVTTGICE